MAKFEGIKQELKRSKGKAFALGACALLASWSWSGILFGGESERPISAPLVAINDAPMNQDIATPIQNFQAQTPQETVHSFGMAMQKLNTWRGPLGLHLDKPAIQRISTPKSHKAAETAVEEPKFTEEQFATPPRLSGTALFSEGKFALFEGLRVQEGEYFGRYFLEAVRSREVDLLDGSRRLTIRLDSQSSTAVAQ